MVRTVRVPNGGKPSTRLLFNSSSSGVRHSGCPKGRVPFWPYSSTTGVCVQVQHIFYRTVITTTTAIQYTVKRLNYGAAIILHVCVFVQRKSVV